MKLPWRVRKAIAQIQHDEGHAFTAATQLPVLSSHDIPSPAVLLEDGVRLAGPANALHDDIRKSGGGNYSFWYDQVYFSTSDNSDPRTNGRCYEIEYLFADVHPVAKNFRRFLRGLRERHAQGAGSADKGTPVNFGKRKVDKEALVSDLDYAVSIAKNFIRLLPKQEKSLRGKVVLEIGPGINFGTTLLMAVYGARIMVSDLYLSPWDPDYHPRFYTLLRNWVRENIPGADIAPLDRILAYGGYDPEVIGCYATPLEELQGIEDASVDVIFSNAVFEHLIDPLRSFQQLARVSRPGALGYHQVDFRDHNDFSRPLEFLLIEDQSFEVEFKEKHGERGNRFRPEEYRELFGECGFIIERFIPSAITDEGYLKAFIPRLREAKNTKYRDIPEAHLKQVSGCFCVQKEG